jgi:hypothetical protein
MRSLTAQVTSRISPGVKNPRETDAYDTPEERTQLNSDCCSTLFRHHSLKRFLRGVLVTLSDNASIKYFTTMKHLLWYVVLRTLQVSWFWYYCLGRISGLSGVHGPCMVSALSFGLAPHVIAGTDTSIHWTRTSGEPLSFSFSARESKRVTVAPLHTVNEPDTTTSGSLTMLINQTGWVTRPRIPISMTLIV